MPSNDRRRHTSTVTIAVLDGKTSPVVDLDPRDVTETTYRASGKGGQHRNKTDSAVRVVHHPTGIIVCSENSRSQHENRERAWKGLQERLQREADEAFAQDVNSSRRDQIETAERPTRDFTWTAWRDEVRDHESGQRWRMSDFLKGKIKL